MMTVRFASKALTDIKPDYFPVAQFAESYHNQCFGAYQKGIELLRQGQLDRADLEFRTAVGGDHNDYVPRTEYDSYASHARGVLQLLSGRPMDLWSEEVLVPHVPKKYGHHHDFKLLHAAEHFNLATSAEMQHQHEDVVKHLKLAANILLRYSDWLQRSEDQLRRDLLAEFKRYQEPTVTQRVGRRFFPWTKAAKPPQVQDKPPYLKAEFFQTPGLKPKPIVLITLKHLTTRYTT